MANEDVPRTALLNFRFLGASVLGSLAMGLVAVYGDLSTQVAALGVWVSALAGLYLAYVEQEEARDRRRAESLERLGVPLTLAAAPDLLAHHRALSDALVRLAAHPDPVLRDVALGELAAAGDRLRALARGEVTFDGTEAWRTVYEKLLASPGVARYRSVAWVRTPDYWQDPPGRQSMRANYAMAARGGVVERVVIVGVGLWADAEAGPVEPVRRWVLDQLARGIDIHLVREADLRNEPDLLADFGIYGDRAVGHHAVDAYGGTERFTLRFDQEAVRAATRRWERLMLYPIPFDGGPPAGGKPRNPQAGGRSRLDRSR